MSDKRTQLLEAAINLFAAEGFWNTPTAQIARHAHVATGTLFNYFPTKEALIDAVYIQLKQEWVADVLAGYPTGGSFRAQCEHIWYRYVEWGVRQPHRYALMQQLRLSNLVSAAAQAQQAADMTFADELIARGLAEGVLASVPPDYFARLTLANIEAAIDHATAHDLRDMALAQHVTGSFALFWEGVSR